MNRVLRQKYETEICYCSCAKYAEHLNILLNEFDGLPVVFCNSVETDFFISNALISDGFQPIQY